MPSITSAAVLVAVAALGMAGSPVATAGAAPPAGARTAPAGVTAADLRSGLTAATSRNGLTAATSRNALTAATLQIGRQTLPANDGWAAAGTGTTGGSAADDAHVTVAHN